MMEKIYEEFEMKSWDRDEEKERVEELEECIRIIRRILDEEMELNEKVSEIESVIKSLE